MCEVLFKTLLIVVLLALPSSGWAQENGVRRPTTQPARRSATTRPAQSTGYTAPGAASRLRYNPDSWLEFTDLVLIDPPGTGWSRAAKADDKSFYGVRADAQLIRFGAAFAMPGRTRLRRPALIVTRSFLCALRPGSMPPDRRTPGRRR